MNKLFVIAISLAGLFSASNSLAHSNSEHGAMLKFADGQLVTELKDINNILKTVGVSLERFDVPEESIPLLEAAMQTPLSAQQKQRVLKLFSLSRSENIAQARKAGREPVIPGGGSMTTGEVGVAPYPKVYDLKSMSSQDRLSARNKFARLHVNATDDMLGVDEVMTMPVGGAWTWYFQVGNQAVELHMSKVKPGEPAWRLNYPGTTPHGAYFHASEGLTIAYITGPKTWTMRYVAPDLPNNKLLGSNPFINFEQKSR